MQKFHKGFTLIEMLIVIVIIGILAAALIPRMRDVQARARDAKRKVDMQQIANALEIFYADNSVYPRSYVNNHYKYSTNNLPLRMTGLENLLTSLPIDPINNYTGPNRGTGLLGNNLQNPSQYAYAYYYFGPTSTMQWDGKGIYRMYAVLENKKDPDRCEIRQYRTRYSTFGWWNTCPVSSGNYLYVYYPSPYSFPAN